MSSAPRRASARETVYEEVRQRIITYALPPGAPISENDIGSEFGVSRTPVREALLLLASEGFAQVRPKVGSFVSKLHMNEIREAQFLREAVECASIASLSYPLDEEVMNGLAVNIRRQQEREHSVAEFIRLDDEFHRGLMRLANREASWRVVAGAKGHLDRARHVTHTTRVAQDSLIEQHAAVFRAVENGNVAEAEEQLRSHLRIVIRDIELLEEASPGIFDQPTLRVPLENG